MLSINALRFNYKNGNILEWPDFHLKKGEALVLLGASGSGKTTLLHLIAGLLRPLSGSIEVNGTTLHELSKKELDKFRGHQMGILFQQTHYWSSLTNAENVELALKMSTNQVNRSEIILRFEQLGIDHLVDKKPQYCSVGERQRLGIILATIHQPSLVLADEPTSALDEKNCESALKLLKEQVIDRNSSLLLITHDRRVTQHFEQVIQLEDIK